MTLLRTFVASLAALAFAGCSSGKPVTMSDAFDIDIFGPHQDDLHTPYVSGAQFNITVSGESSDSQAGWQVTSSNPEVIQVTGGLAQGSAGVTCLKPGNAILSVVAPNGDVLDTRAVSVAVPDHVGLYAEGPLLTGAADQTAEISTASVVADGQATFLVRYFLQGVELYGSGALTPTGTGGVTASTVSASFATARDFLQVTPAAMGASGSVSLLVDHNVVGELPVTAVLPSSVTQVTLLAQSTATAQQGDSLVLYAHAIDASSSEVYGASFAWKINGQTQSSLFVGGPADLFFYNYDGSVTEDVAASYEKYAPYAIVHGQGGSVGSTSNIGCSLTGGAGAGATSMLGLGLGIVAIAFARRRRTADAAG
jgi:MYXO-CTERM domain-containing protein